MTHPQDPRQPDGQVPPEQRPPQGQPDPPGQQYPQGPHAPQNQYGPPGPPQGPPPQGAPGPYPPAPPKKGRGVVIGVAVGVGLLVVALVAVTGAVLWAVNDGGGADPAPGSADLDAVVEYEGLPADHVEPPATVDYEMFPPAGGEHYGYWQNCGVYEVPIRNETAVHSLEHGAVWVTYDPAAVDGDGAATLAAHYRQGDYLLVSPVEQGMPAPVVASAWGAQIHLDGPDDPRLAAFVRRYEQSPQAPEPGAPCSGSHDGTADEALLTVDSEDTDTDELLDMED